MGAVYLKRTVQFGLLFFFFFMFQLTGKAQFYSGSQLTFGKNRVQYIDRIWSQLRFEEFDTYFYQQGKPLAIYTARYFSSVKPVIEARLQTQFSGKIQFVIFNKMTDLRQSNVGFISDQQYNIGGQTHIVGSKVFLYFNGDYLDFQKQIKAGFTNILINQMLYGQFFTSMIKNSTLLSLPDWYVQGLISYYSDEWNVEIDNYVRDGILSNRYKDFHRLRPEDAVYAGHSFWYFIAQRYGPEIIPNIVFMTRASRSIENGFLFILGITHKNLMTDWLEFYKNIYETEDAQSIFPENLILSNRYKKNIDYHSVKSSPGGRYVAYVTNNMGRSVLWLYDTQTLKRKRLLKQGYRLDEKVDLSYPLIDWHPSGEILTIIREEKGLTALYFYTVEDKKMEKRFLYHFDKVLDFSYAPNGRLLAVSAVINGKTNIYVYNVAANTFEVITNDSYNDFEPVFSADNKLIYFSSYRLNDTLVTERPDEIFVNDIQSRNLFAYNYAERDPVLRRVTNSHSNLFRPQTIDKRHISYLSDESGIINRYIARFDSAISHIDTTIHYRYFAISEPVTNYNRSLMEHSIDHNQSFSTDLIYKGGSYFILRQPIDEIFYQTTTPEQTNFIKLQREIEFNRLQEIENQNDTLEPVREDSLIDVPERTQRKRLIVIGAEEQSSEGKIDTDNFLFNDEISRDTGRTASDSNEGMSNDSISDDIQEFYIPRARNYYVEYTIDQMVNQLDFSYLNASYQTFTGGSNPIYINPGFNALFKLGLTDLLEDNRIVGGLRFSLDFNQTEYLLSYEMLQKRLDRQITFYRQKFDEMAGSTSLKRNTTHLFYYSLKWPFSNVFAVKATTTYRYDRGVYLSTDLDNLKKPNVNTHWGGFKTELIFDNTRYQGYNTFLGSRYKLFGEYFRKIPEKESDLFVVGADFRNYQKLYKNIIWANRFAASTSFGNSRLIYYMGGVDTWLFPKFNDSISIATDQNYVYQTLATNMRGFTQNIRNGNNFALVNSEIRFPVIRFFSDKPLKSELLNSFQLIGFFDIGTAWNGLSPYYKDNPFFTQVYESPYSPVKITVYTQKEPIVAGYGAGLRAKVFGYFLRADMAWGIDDGVVRKPVFYLSMSLDF